MKLSHSKLSTILTCPMTYYLSYIQGIKPKVEKAAFSIGSAVHWGIEHNTEDLSDYYNIDFRHKDNYTREQLLTEAMVHGYLKNKKSIFEQIVKTDNDENLNIVDELHEIKLTAKLKSNMYDYEHEFVGIIDLLLLTNKGFVVIDYKTSSYEPNWDNYLDQIYRYIFLLKSEFPDIPVCKIGIINIRKSNIRQKKTETEEQFLNRLKLEYEIYDESYIVYKEFDIDKLDKTLIDEYIDNLSKMCDTADMIDKNKAWYINFYAANTPYRSEYWDIFYNKPDAYLLYKINDTFLDKEDNMIKQSRDCKPLDMLTISNTNVMNHYKLFEQEINDNHISIDDRQAINKLLKKYKTDKELIDNYVEVYKMLNT